MLFSRSLVATLFSATLLLPAWGNDAKNGGLTLIAHLYGSVDPDDCLNNSTNPLCAMGISVSDNLIAIGSNRVYDYGVDLYDITNPRQPQFLLNWAPTDSRCDGYCRTDIAQYDTESERLQRMRFSEGVEVFDGFGYFASAGMAGTGTGGGVYIVDLQNPSSYGFARVTAHIPSPNGYAWKVHNLQVDTINGSTWLYLSGIYEEVPSGGGGYTDTHLPGIYVYEVSDKYSPYLANVISMPSDVNAPGNSWIHDTKVVRRTDSYSTSRVYLFASALHANGGSHYSSNPWTRAPILDRIAAFDITYGGSYIYQSGYFEAGNKTHSSSFSPDVQYLYETLEPAYAEAAWGSSSGGTPNSTYHSYCANSGGWEPAGTPCQLPPNTSTLQVQSLSWDDDYNQVTASPVSSTLDDPGNYGLDWRAAAHFSATQNDLLAVAWYRQGLQVFRMSDPSDPIQIGSYNTYDMNGFAADWWNTGTVFQGPAEVDWLPNGMVAMSDSRKGLMIFAVGEMPLAVTSTLVLY